ncbi:S41 family peptidase [bacterium]|nr:S41 family peptidase [bacterium]
MKFKKKIVLVFLFLFTLSGSFVFGFYLGKWQCPVCPPEEVDLSLLWQAWRILEERFVDKAAIDTQKMIYGAVSGMVKALGDPYTVFLNPEDTKRFIEDVKGTFEGVGMEIAIRKGQLQVVAPLEGTPAQKAGLLPGDKIMEVDGVSTADMTIEEAVDRIRGPKGTEVTLTIIREGWTEPKKISIIRGIIEVPSLKWEILEENIAYIKIYHFSEKASSDFRQAALEILNSPVDRIILDLRNNPGGYLEVAQDIAGWFLERDKVIAIEDFGNGERKEWKGRGPSSFVEYPIVVLINKGSASGSEILAGALRDNRNILLIGEKSFGKGSVQELERLSGGSSLKITVAKWLTPKGELITDKGLEPDIKVEMSFEDFEKGMDPQLEKAIEIVKNL